MPVYDIIANILTRKKQSCAMELRNFFIQKDREPISKQAYFKARQNLNPEVFTYLNDEYLKEFYKSNEEVKTWNGYVVFAIDGSKVEIANSAENRENYGVMINNRNTESPARAMISGLFDVFNRFFIDLQICNVNDSEIEAGKRNLLAIKRIGLTQKTLIIFDRGYPSFELLYFLEELGLKYIIRLSSNRFKREREAVKSDDEEIELEITKERLRNVGKKSPELYEEMKKLQSIKTRLVKEESPSGQEFSVLTNLSKEISGEEICKAYFFRWKIEEAYNTLKNKMKFESVSGQKSIYVEQDFRAQIYIYNMIEDMITYLEEKKLKNEENKLKYHQRINENLAIGVFSQEFINIVMEENVKKRIERMKALETEMEKYFRPVRSYPSKKRRFSTSNKYSANQKNSF